MAWLKRDSLAAFALSLVPWVAIALVLVGIVFIKRSGSLNKGAVSCPIYYDTAIGGILPKDQVMGRWHVYRFDGGKGTAEVKVSTSTTTTPSRPRSCQLVIEQAPETPGNGSDWRIGHALKSDSLRGKTVRFKVTIKADRNIMLDTGQVYANDGSKVLAAATSQLTPEWKSFEVSMPVDQASTTLEIWFRLLMDTGTVKPGSGTLYFVTEVDIQGG